MIRTRIATSHCRRNWPLTPSKYSDRDSEYIPCHCRRNQRNTKRHHFFHDYSVVFSIVTKVRVYYTSRNHMILRVRTKSLSTKLATYSSTYSDRDSKYATSHCRRNQPHTLSTYSDRDSEYVPCRCRRNQPNTPSTYSDRDYSVVFSIVTRLRVYDIPRNLMLLPVLFLIVTKVRVYHTPRNLMLLRVRTKSLSTKLPTNSETPFLP